MPEMNDSVNAVKNAALGCCRLCPFSSASQLLFCFDFFFFLPLWVLPDPGISSVVEGRPVERLPSRGNDSFIQSQLSGRRHPCPVPHCDSPPPAASRACQSLCSHSSSLGFPSWRHSGERTERLGNEEGGEEYSPAQPLCSHQDLGS